jgi:hypothetical protein
LAYDVGAEPRSVAVADLTGNGIPDLVTADGNISGQHAGHSPGVSVLLGNGDGTFQAARTFPAGDNPIAVVVGDFNGDGIPDLAVADAAVIRGRSAVCVLLGNGDGTFQAPRFYDAGVHPRGLVVGDFRGKGILDLAVADDGTFPNYPDSGVSLLLGNGDGTFQSPILYPSGPEVTSVAVADLTGKGILDLVATNLRGNTVSILMGNGDGTFATARTFAAGTNPISVTAGDFKGNGIPDLAVTNYNTSGTLNILLGNGDGTFQAPTSYAAGDHPTAMVVGDFQSQRCPRPRLRSRFGLRQSRRAPGQWRWHLPDGRQLR